MLTFRAQKSEEYQRGKIPEFLLMLFDWCLQWLHSERLMLAVHECEPLEESGWSFATAFGRAESGLGDGRLFRTRFPTWLNYSLTVAQHNMVLKIQSEIRGNTCNTAWSNRCLDWCMDIGDHIPQSICALLHFHGIQEMVCAAPKAREQSGLLNADVLQGTIYRQCATQISSNQLWFCRAPSLKQHKGNAQLLSFMTGQRHSWQCEGLLACRPVSCLLVSATSFELGFPWAYTEMLQ